MQNLGYYNGKIDLIENIMIPMNDRVCYFGDGVYDAGPCRNYHIFAIDEHINRFFRSASKLNITMPMSKEELKALLNDLVKKLDTGDLFVYYQVTRGTAPRKHDYEDGPGNLWVMIKPAVQYKNAPPMKLITLPDTRFLHCDIKTLNLIPSVVASQEAKKAGCDETIFYREGGRVTECAHSNVHILKNGTIYTAPADNLILAGIARAHLINMCKQLGIPCEEKVYHLEDVFDADEIFVTSSSQIMRDVCEIDGKKVGGKDEATKKRLTAALWEEYETATSL